jgi:hypothetical protein
MLAALAAPGSAHAAGATIVSRDLPVGGARLVASAQAPMRFDLVGLHWRGSGKVEFRTRALDGGWSRWQAAAPDAEDLPDPGSRERRTRHGWHLGNPWWTGSSDRIEWRVSGRVRRLRGWFVRSPAARVPLRAASLAGSPAILSRLAWGADEHVRRGRPSYAPAIRLAIVHHTAGRNDYRPEEAPAIVRAIQLYHVKGNGWLDLGYNFLVDRYGRVFEGRYGGIERSVIGAHAAGFNTGSVGVAMLGTYGQRAPSLKAQAALASLLVWRLDVAHVDPLSTTPFSSRGNARFPAGVAVFLPRIAGHSDTGFTSCPGDAFHRRLAAISAQIASLGLPKLYAPIVTGALGGPIHFSARLSTARAWSVAITRAGATVARGSGAGSDVSWTWDSRQAPPGVYAWTMEAGAAVRPARGTLGRAQPPPFPPPPPSPPAPPPVRPPAPSSAVLRDLLVAVAVVSPNGDGFADVLGIEYVLGRRSLVTATVLDSAGAVVATLFAGQRQSARRVAFAWDPGALSDGLYTLVVEARPEGADATIAAAEFHLDRTLGWVAVDPSSVSPNGDGIEDVANVSFSLARDAPVRLEVRQAGATVATVFEGALPSGVHALAWDPVSAGVAVPEGRYELAVTVTDNPAVVQAAAFDVDYG